MTKEAEERLYILEAVVDDIMGILGDSLPHTREHLTNVYDSWNRAIEANNDKQD